MREAGILRVVVIKRVTLLVVLAVAFAPAVLAACQATCVSHDRITSAGTTSHHHSHTASHSAPAGHAHSGMHTGITDQTTPTAVLRSCDHQGTLPDATVALERGLLAPADVASPIELPLGSIQTTRAPGNDSSTSSVRLARSTHIRV